MPRTVSVMITPRRIAVLGALFVLTAVVAIVALRQRPAATPAVQEPDDAAAARSTVARERRDAVADEPNASGVTPLPEPDQAALAALRDSATPLTQRLATVRALGRRAARADATAVATLLAVSGQPGALVAPAHRALDTVAPALRPAILALLRPRLAHREAAVAMAAIELLGRLGESAAVPWLDKVLCDNRRRPDGFGQQVRACAARALARIGDAQAVPALARELRWITTTSMQSELDYGDAVVEALRSTRSPAARPALEHYADVLHRARPDDGPVRVAIDTHLAIVHEAVAALDVHLSH